MKSARQTSPTRRSIRAPTSATAGQATGGSNQRSTSPGHGGVMDILGGDEVTMQAKIFQLEKDLERRQESYITRERAYKVRIDELEEELTAQKASKTGWMKHDKKIGELKQMQHQILNNVELVQDRTARIMQEQERDLLRAFKARLFDVQTELEKEKSKKDDGAAAWIEKSRQLEAEVEWAKEVADRLERVNQTLLQENNRLKSQFTSQEEDRNFLIKQLVSVKKDNARLRAEYSVLEAENERTTTKLNAELEKHAAMAPPVKATGTNAQALQLKLDSEERYKEVNIRLKRLLGEERKSLMQIRQNYAQELKVRTDMEMLLRQCVDDVRQEIARRHVENAQFSSNSGNDLARLYSKTPGSIPVEEFGQEDRERVLELLLSQERVVSLVYAKTFPVTVGGQKGGAAGGHALDSTAGGAGGASLDALLDGGALGSSGGFDDLNLMGGGGNNTNSRPHTASAAVNGSNNNGLAGGGGGNEGAKSATKLPQLGSRVVSH